MPLPALIPTSYHRRTRDLLRLQEPGLWDWFASDRFEQEHAQRVRLELLKSTYRLEEGAHPQLYRLAAQVMEALGLALPLDDLPVGRWRLDERRPVLRSRRGSTSCSPDRC